MHKPFRRRVYLFITRENLGTRQLRVFSTTDPRLGPGLMTPGGTVEPNEGTEEAALREAAEETGLTRFDAPLLVAEDDYESIDELLKRSFYHLTVSEPAPDVWTHVVMGQGSDGGVPFTLQWIDLPEANGLEPHFRAYLERLFVMI